MFAKGPDEMTISKLAAELRFSALSTCKEELFSGNANDDTSFIEQDPLIPESVRFSLGILAASPIMWSR